MTASIPRAISPLPPVWWLEFRRLFQAGIAHCFVVSGDVNGVTAYHGFTQHSFLNAALTRDVVAWYHPATGITFPIPSMRETAVEILGPNWQPPATTDDRFASALDAAGIPAVETDVFSSARTPAKALAILNDLLHSPQAVSQGGTEEHPVVQGRVAVILDRADLIIPATGKAQMTDERLAVLATLLSWGHDPTLVLQQNPVVLLTPQRREVHPDLLVSSSGYRGIEQPLPDEATRLAYLEWYLFEHRQQNPIHLLDVSLEELARATAGLDLRQVEDVLLVGASRADRAPETASGVSRAHVKERKDAIIREEFGDVISMIDPLPGGLANLGGMRPFVTWFRQELLEPLRAGRLRDIPKGILLIGPPGVGKTRLVAAMAEELLFSAIQIHMAQILGGVVGTSEHNLWRVFGMARHLAPTFLFLDEIDQTLVSQRGNSSGSPVAANLFGAMLQFLGDERLRGKVLVIGATNHPERLDPALRRPGRFEVAFPLISPEREGRFEILAIQARQQGISLTPGAHALLAAETERYSGADLEALMAEARFLCTCQGVNTIDIVQARAALDNVRPVTLASVEGYTRHAIEACTNLRYLPEKIAAAERARLVQARQVPGFEAAAQAGVRGARQL